MKHHRIHIEVRPAEPAVLPSLKHYRRLRVGSILRPTDRHWNEGAGGWTCTLLVGGIVDRLDNGKYYRPMTKAQISAARRQRKEPS